MPASSANYYKFIVISRFTHYGRLFIAPGLAHIYEPPFLFHLFCFQLWLPYWIRISIKIMI